ncbi:MAG: 5'-methylthioadenosine/S-adenosylhomocysteine nucleosidase [Acholeplasmataceae bacterium]
MILVCAAMTSEVNAILAFYPFKKIDEGLFRYQYHTKEILLTITGIGKVEAAHQLTKILATYKVQKIYNIGLAGATPPYHQGDIIAIEHATYHDFDLTIFGYKKGQVPGRPHPFLSDPKMLKHACDKLNIQKAQCYTGDYFMTETLPGAYVVDMEGAALYHVALLENIPILAIKVISDVLGMDQHVASYQAFEEKQGAEILRTIFQKVVVEG